MQPERGLIPKRKITLELRVRGSQFKTYSDFTFNPLKH